MCSHEIVLIITGQRPTPNSFSLLGGQSPMWEFPAWKFFSLDSSVFALFLTSYPLGLGSILHVAKLGFQASMAMDTIGIFCTSTELFHFIQSLQVAQNYHIYLTCISNRAQDRIQYLYMMFQQMVQEIFTAENWRIMDQTVWSQPSVAGLCGYTEI